jgi:hypothetical protein
MLWLSCLKACGIEKNVFDSFWQSSMASIAIGYAAYGGLNLFDNFFNLNTFIGIFMQGLLSGILGIGAGIIILILIGNHEVRVVWAVLHSKIWKTKPITESEPELL